MTGEDRLDAPQSAAPRFRIHCAAHQGDLVIELAGELDLPAESALRALAAECPARSHVVVDLSGVQFLDSGAAAALSDLSAAIHARGGALVVDHLSAPARQTLDMLRIDRHRLTAPDDTRP